MRSIRAFLSNNKLRSSFSFIGCGCLQYIYIYIYIYILSLNRMNWSIMDANVTSISVGNQ
jgi:hypothetical protein